MISTPGCTDASARLTLESNHALAGTQVASIRITATVQAARARTTIDAVQTRAAAAEEQSQYLEATLIRLGTPEESLEQFRESILINQATETPLSTLAIRAEELNRSEISSPTPNFDAGSPTPTVPIVTPASARIVVSPTFAPLPTGSELPHLENLVMATGVRNDDCAREVTGLFSSRSQEIYIVAEAVNILSGSVVEARCFQEENPIGPIYSFSPDDDIERACIWFYVDPSDFEFIPGQYGVELYLDGLLASPRVPFTITTR